MSEFFKSEVVRAEMAEIQELQEEVYETAFKFPNMPIEDQKYHVEVLERLIDKQRVMYTRLSLSEDPEAKQMKKQITSGAVDMRLPENADMNVIFNNMIQAVGMMRRHIDNTAS